MLREGPNCQIFEYHQRKRKRSFQFKLMFILCKSLLNTIIPVPIVKQEFEQNIVEHENIFSKLNKTISPTPRGMWWCWHLNSSHRAMFLCCKISILIHSQWMTYDNVFIQIDYRSLMISAEQRHRWLMIFSICLFTRVVFYKLFMSLHHFLRELHSWLSRWKRVKGGDLSTRI